jgi:predicted MFS family arabinose efflux permease
VSNLAMTDRRRTRLFGSLCSMVFLVNMARVVFAPFVEHFRGEFAATSTGAVALVASLVWLGSALPRLPTGYLLTRVPRHHVVLGTGVMLTVAAAFTATAATLPMLYVGAFAMGLSSGAYFIAANPLVSELYPDRVGRAIGIHGTASQLAAVVAPVFVTVVLATSDWRLAFWLIAATAASATAVLYVVSRRAEMPSAGAGDRDILTALRAQWPLVLSGVAIIGATGFVWNGVFNLYVTYLTETKGLAEPTARNVLTVIFATGVPAFWLTGRIADRVPHVPLMLTILGSFVVCLAAITLASGLAAIVAVSAVTGYVIHSLFPALDTYMLGSLPDEHRGSAYAVYSASMMLVSAGGSVAVGALRDADWAFDAIFRTFAGGLTLVLLALLAANALGWLPDGAGPTDDGV